MVGDGTQPFENNTISGNVVGGGFSVGGDAGSTDVVGNAIENNHALYIDIGLGGGEFHNNVIESNTADYGILAEGSSWQNNVTKNKAHTISLRSDFSDDISSNTMEDMLAVTKDTHVTIVNNTAFSIEKSDTSATSSDVSANNLYSNGEVEMSVFFRTDRNGSLVEKKSMKPLFDPNSFTVQYRPGIGNTKTTHTSSIAFSGLDAGVISAITDNVTAVAAGDLKTTAVSAAQAVTVQAQIAALTVALADANAAILVAAANITALTSGFCVLAATVSQSPASLTPFMSLAGCVTVPPAQATISGQDKKDLLALLVLLAIPAAAAAHFANKYRERLQAGHAAHTQAVGAERTVGGGKAQQAVDVIVDAA